MKKIIYLNCLVLSLSIFGCSTNSEDNEDNYMQLNSMLKACVDTLYINETNYISIIPKSWDIERYDVFEYKEYINSIDYYLYDKFIGNSYVFPFAIEYNPTTSFDHRIVPPCDATIRIKPTLKENIVWEPQETKIKIVIREEPKPEIIPVTGIKMKLSDHSDEFQFLRKNILIGNYLIVETAIYPNNATNKNYTLESSDNEVAKIEFANNQYYITTNKIGFTEITAKTEDGNHTATCELSVCEVDAFAKIKLNVGTEGNSITGFYSYVQAEFYLSINTPVNIKELKVTNEKGKSMLLYENIGEKVIYSTEKIITSQGLETYQATGWKAEATYTWNNKEYYISYVKQ